MVATSVAVTGVIACGGGGSGSTSTVPYLALGEPCPQAEKSCAPDAFCLQVGTYSDLPYQVCSKPCTTDSECPSDFIPLACGIAPDGSSACVPACGAGLNTSFVCRNGRPVACEQLDHTFCDDCGCPADAPRCESGVGCFPLSDVGGPCGQDSDCRTGNCSTYANVCRVPVGQACNSVDDCDLCMSLPSGWSYCSRECVGDSQCNGGYCLGNVDTGYFTCRQPCSSTADPSCPTSCQYTSDYSEVFCDCSSCTSQSPQRALGMPCISADQCVDGECYTDHNCNDYCGECTKTCTATSDCSAGSTCANVPCASGETGTCGFKCLPNCASSADCQMGTCHTRATSEASSTNVCDVKLDDGVTCYADSDCMSLKCTANACTPPGGAANGSPCTASTDCASANCSSGVCKGTALLGDACVNNYDCAAGQCCAGVCGSC